jgi:hypothetical protein
VNYDNIIVKRRRIISPSNAFFSQEPVVDDGNLLTQPKAFDHADWTKGGSTIDDNSTTDPDGGSLADSIFEDGTNAQHFVSQSITKAASSISYDFSVYAQAFNRTRVTLVLHDGAGNGRLVTFDLAGEQIGAAPAGFGSGFSGGSASITEPVSGWYLCEFDGVSTNSATTLVAAINVDGDTGTNAGAISFQGLSQGSLNLYNAVLTVT